jgi:hypothetical protein
MNAQLPFEEIAGAYDAVLLDTNVFIGSIEEQKRLPDKITCSVRYAQERDQTFSRSFRLFRKFLESEKYPVFITPGVLDELHLDFNEQGNLRRLYHIIKRKRINGTYVKPKSSSYDCSNLHKASKISAKTKRDKQRLERILLENNRVLTFPEDIERTHLGEFVMNFEGDPSETDRRLLLTAFYLLQQKETRKVAIASNDTELKNLLLKTIDKGFFNGFIHPWFYFRVEYNKFL